MRENVVEARLTLRVRLVGGRTIKMMPVETGMPDRLVILNGRFYFVETKAPNGVVSPAQANLHRKLWEEQGIPVAVLSRPSQVDAWVRDAFNGPKPEGPLCDICEAPLPERKPGTPGRAPIYCERCRDGYLLPEDKLGAVAP